MKLKRNGVLFNLKKNYLQYKKNDRWMRNRIFRAKRTSTLFNRYGYCLAARYVDWTGFAKQKMKQTKQAKAFI